MKRDLLREADGERPRLRKHVSGVPPLSARRYETIASALLLEQGNPVECSEARKQLIKRFAAVAVLAEQLEVRLACGEEININQHAVLCSTLVRIAQALGIDRQAPNSAPTLSAYLRGE
jgi:hypothetical protein